MFESIWCEVEDTKDDIHLRMIVTKTEVAFYSEDFGVSFEISSLELNSSFAVDLYLNFNLTMGKTLVTIKQFEKMLNTARLLMVIV